MLAFINFIPGLPKPFTINLLKIYKTSSTQLHLPHLIHSVKKAAGFFYLLNISLSGLLA
jgi:hypothetical protein